MIANNNIGFVKPDNSYYLLQFIWPPFINYYLKKGLHLFQSCSTLLVIIYNYKIKQYFKSLCQFTVASAFIKKKNLLCTDFSFVELLWMGRIDL
jgi:hypothetical protein